MDKAAKLFLNSLKCPVCGGQIDLFEWAKPVSKKGNNFGCVADPSHYGIFFVHWEQPFRLEQEIATVNVNGYQYEVIQHYWMGGLKVEITTIYIHPIDPEQRRIDGSKSKCVTFQKHLFNFSQTNKHKLINKIKTILVFQ